MYTVALVHTGVIPEEQPALKEIGKLISYVGYLVASDGSSTSQTAIQHHSFDSGSVNTESVKNGDCSGAGCKRRGEPNNEKDRHNHENDADRGYEQNNQERSAISVADFEYYGEMDYDGYDRRFNDNYYGSRSRRYEDWP